MRQKKNSNSKPSRNRRTTRRASRQAPPAAAAPNRSSPSADPLRRVNDLASLHPAVRAKVAAVQAELARENIPLEVFESFRTPQRQNDLFAQGRTKPGKIVTKARAWRSYHQFGCAVDFVFHENGEWHWGKGAKYDRWYDRLHEIGRRHGLEPLSWETPHLQLVGTSTEQLAAGRYPEDGDLSWAENLASVIHSWRGQPAAPPPPSLIPGRPELKAGIAAAPRMRGLRAAAGAGVFGSERERFEHILKRFTFKWECVFDRQGRVIAEDDPDDPGGVTKYGIDKSGHPDLTIEQIRALTEPQAVDIYFRGEWPDSHAAELATPLGEIAFDMTTLDGRGRAMRALQSACGLTGSDVDGAWGPTTLRAATEAAEERDRLMRTADRMLDWRAARYYNLIESTPKLAKYLKGWLNRTNALREFLSVPDLA